jgi:hypothetical protein
MSTISTRRCVSWLKGPRTSSRFPLSLCASYSLNGMDAERAQWVKETRHAARRIGEGARERDRLRAVVDAAMLLWYATYPTGPATASFIEARRAFEEAAAALDGSAEATDA